MKIVLAGLVGLVLSGAVGAEPVVEGRVRLASGDAAVGAQVLVFDLADLRRWVGTTTDESGQFVLSLGALGSGQALPEGFGLGQNYPNPFNPRTVIPYKLAADGSVRLEVFNLLGQRVVTLVDGEQAAGGYTARWDARAASGQGVAAGVYVYRLTAGGGTATRRMVLVDGPAGGGPVGAAPSPGAAVDPVIATGGYGLTVSGVGLATYVDADFRVGAGPVEVVVEAAATGRGKAAQSGALGDVNGDGWVNIVDALLVATYSVNPTISVLGDIALGDVNGDGRVNGEDALLIATYSVNPSDPSLPPGIGQPMEDTGNQPPIAHAGPDQSVDRRETIALDGSDSSDPEGQGLSFVWRQVAGEPVELSNAEVAEPTFNTQVTGLYAFELVVHDGRIASAPDTVGIEVVALADAAVLVGGPDAALVYESTTGDQLTFRVQGTAAPVAVGDVMVHTVEPYFLKKVLSVQRQNATEVVVRTKDAALTDVIEEAQIRRTFRLPAAKAVVGPELRIGNLVLGGSTDADVSITQGELSFERQVVLDWEILRRRSRFFTMHLTGDIVALLEMRLESSRDWSLEVEVPLVEHSYNQLFFVGPVPVLIQYEADFGVGVGLVTESASSLTAGIQITKPISIGLKYENGLWENLTGGAAGTYEALGPEFEKEAAVDIRGYLFGELHAELYALAGPYFGVKPYFGFGTARALRAVRDQVEEEQLEWSLHTGMDGFVGVGTGFLDYIGINEANVEWEFNIFDYSLIDGIIALTPDVLVDGLRVSPSSPEAGESATVQVRVANEGTGRASPAWVVLRVNGVEVARKSVVLAAGEDTEMSFAGQVLGAGSNVLEVEVDPDGLLVSETVRGNNRVSQTLTLTPQVALARSVVFVLDLSGSMDDAAGDGRSRLEAAKAALAQVLAGAPTDGSQEYALTTFSGCGGVSVPIDFTVDVQGVVDYSAGLRADGGTPLAAALRKAQHLALDEASSEDILLVLLSDGEETCDGDPVAVAEKIGQGVRAKAVASLGVLAKVISVNTIGFGVEPGSAADQQIQEIAKKAGGNYFRASETADLALALGQASGLAQTRIPTLSGQVTDADGNPIQGALVQLRNMQENTDAHGRYLFPARVQGVDSLIVTAEGYARFEAEVYLFDVDKTYDVQLGSGTFTLPLGGAEMSFVWIEPGVFQMGSPSSEVGHRSDEGPLHEVEISRGFWLGQYEVTQGQWEAVMGDNPSLYRGDDRPVESVFWYDVHEFIGRLNAAAGDSLYRLPTEAEWEYACRAGTSTRWSFGDDESRLTNYAWYDDNTRPWSTRAVGQKLPNPWGLYDMYGNVWEWVQDWYDSDYYNSSPRVDPPGPDTGSFRVRRGGYFRNDTRTLRSAERAYSSPDIGTGYIGVRLVRIR